MDMYYESLFILHNDEIMLIFIVKTSAQRAAFLERPWRLVITLSSGVRDLVSYKYDWHTRQVVYYSRVILKFP